MTKTKQEKQIVDIMQNIKLFLGLQITFRDPDIIKYNTGMVEFEWASKYQVTKDFEHHYKSTKKKYYSTQHFFFKASLYPIHNIQENKIDLLFPTLQLTH